MSEDRADVADLIQRERAARDQGLWDVLAACWWPDSVVSISWIECTGPEFVEASRKAFEAGVRHVHQMAPSLVTLNGDRAVGDTGCAILLPGKVGEAEVTVTSQARLFMRAERRDGEWRLVGLRPLYFQDAMAARDPGQTVALDRARLAGYRESYRYLSYVLEEGGKTPRPDLAGPDRPDLVAALYAGEAAWLKA